MDLFNKTILIVEDEDPLLKAISAKVKSYGFQYEQAKSVEAALKILKEKKIDVIWLDHYLLGQEDGLDIVTLVKSKEQWSSIPIFVVSNTASADKIRAYINLGVNEYYTKADYRLDTIVDDIKDYLEKNS